MAVRSYYLDEQGALHTELTRRRLSEALSSGKGLLWVDICETTEEDGAMLADVFGFHRLAIEDCVETQIHPPKIDDYGNHLFILVHGINHTAEASEVVETAELALFVGANYVVSNHNFPLYSVEEVRQLVEAGARPLKRGPDFLAYVLIDALVDNVLPTIDRMSEIAEEVENQALSAIRSNDRSWRRAHNVASADAQGRRAGGRDCVLSQGSSLLHR